MSVFDSIILGLVQGLTEFIPVSSTGHLLLARHLLNLPTVGTISFDAIIQLATGLSLLCYFWKDITGLIMAIINFVLRKPVDDKYGKLILPLIIGTIPAIIAGLFLEKYMDTVFRESLTLVAGTLTAGAILFFIAEKISKRKIVENNQSGLVSIGKGLVVGLFQCLALVPGFSRSGSTISGGLIAGLNRELAARFSFLLSIPIIFGSGLKKLLDIGASGELASVELQLIIAGIVAFISGLIAVHFLIKFLKSNSLNWFGAYRIILAVIILLSF